MTDITATQQRRSQIELLSTTAGLLLDEATQQSIKEQVRLAMRDLDEAALWLEQPDVDKRPEIIDIIDLNLGTATRRLQIVDDALAKHGPDATFNG